MKKLLFLVVCCLCLVGVGCEEEHKNHELGKYDLEVLETTLESVYTNNKLDGNKQYFGKRIKTTSTFESISDGTFSGLILYMGNVYCSSFNSKNDETRLSELDRGQSVSVIGTVDEWISNKLNLKDCEILD